MAQQVHSSLYTQKGLKEDMQSNACIYMFIAELFGIAIWQKSPNVMNEQMNFSCLGINRKDALIDAKTWMNIKNSTLSERSQIQKPKMV